MKNRDIYWFTGIKGIVHKISNNYHLQTKNYEYVSKIIDKINSV